MDMDRKRELMMRRSAIPSKVDLPAPAPWHDAKIGRIAAPPPRKPAKL